MAPRIELFAFRYRDPIGGKWIRARYVATREDIAHVNTLSPSGANTQRREHGKAINKDIRVHLI